MTSSGVLAGLAGAGVGLGLTLIIAGLIPTERTTGRSRAKAWLRSRDASRRLGGSAGPSAGRRWWRLLAVVLIAVPAVAVTGWPVVFGFAVAGAWWLPRLLGPDREHEAAIARIEAIAGWAEQLRDTLAAASGLEQAITTTSRTAPAVVRPAVQALADRIHAGQPLPVALAQAADDLADPTADLVIAALTLAARQQASRLAALLSTLTAAAREDAAGRMRTAVARAGVRTSARVIVAATLGVAVVIAVLDSAFLAPYATVEGQLVLAAVGGLFAVAFWWLARIARPPVTPRLFGSGNPP